LALERAIAGLPRPKDGKDAAPVDVDAMKAQLADHCARLASDGETRLQKSIADAVAAIPVPKDGKDGASVTADDVKPILRTLLFDEWAKTSREVLDEAAREAVASMPKPRDGEPGKSVSAEELTPWLEAWLDANFSKWALTAERRVFDLGEKAVAAMPRPRDGRDGPGIDDVYLDGRALKWKMPDGSVKGFTIPIPIYKGVFEDDGDYEVHDMVTFGGSVWVAVSADCSKAKPGTNESWKLAVKKGRDGRDK
jgi:hypothetical protein